VRRLLTGAGIVTGRRSVSRGSKEVEAVGAGQWHVTVDLYGFPAGEETNRLWGMALAAVPEGPPLHLKHSWSLLRGRGRTYAEFYVSHAAIEPYFERLDKMLAVINQWLAAGSATSPGAGTPSEAEDQSTYDDLKRRLDRL
jgi:hypothetical protein